MNLTDPVADMLTRIRNACSAGHRRVDMPVSKLKSEVARLLRDNHYIADFKILDRVTIPDQPIKTGGSVVVEAGRPGAVLSS